jgi:hypothetical protein
MLASILTAIVAFSAPQDREFDDASASRFAELALTCVYREYPNKIAHVMNSDSAARPPRELTPAFYGCFDWHSAVHGHWLLVRLSRRYPTAQFVPAAKAALGRNLTRENIAAELNYVLGEGRGPFERPYGLAWLLQLSAELHSWGDPQSQEWARNLEPLALEAARRFETWLPKLSHPIRTGEHSQTAFAMGLIFDWARTRENRTMQALIRNRARSFYGGDKGWNMSFEPGGQDFLSPGLAEADLMRRVMAPDEFAKWLSAFLPELPTTARPWLPPAIVTDKSDGKLAHLDGLNLSRAWMLEGIVAGLPGDDPRRAGLRATVERHRRMGLAAVTGEHYEGGHWLGSFAVYLVTQRGLEE